jgi:RHS repeat-associated protein
LSVFYIHTDHLNIPRRITRRSTTDVVWSWESDPFGSTAPNENPSGLGAFTFNLRLPGQYFDSETGLNQNYIRDYDPATGKYVESDPIGLNGGVNTYAYVNGNPISAIDPLGLRVAILAHTAASPLGYFTYPASDHTALYLDPDDKCSCPGKWPITVGGQPMNGKLVTRVNVPTDALSNAAFQQTVPTPDGMSDCKFIMQIIAAARSYDNGATYSLPPISSLWPGLWNGRLAPGTYNSNSWVSGVLQGAGATPPALGLPPNVVVTPGYENPIPLH